jgi:DNA-binding XRE family transcriptional regulator
MIELLTPDEIVVDPQTLVAEFYRIELSDDDVLEAAELLENVCPGLGDWYLDLDPDGEFQRDLLAGAKMFWAKRNGSKGIPSERPPFRRGRVSHGTAPFTDCRLARGLSQRTLAQMIGTTQATVSRLENGVIIHTDYIGENIRSGLERVFQVPVDQLLLVKSQKNKLNDVNS